MDSGSSPSERRSPRFIGQPVTVRHEASPTYVKRPGAPDEFTWQGRVFRVTDVLRVWHDYARRGRLAQNMRASHLRAAQSRGSWGVGRDYYRVLTHSGEVFDLYYDRSPKGPDHPEGTWILLRQMSDHRGDAA